MRRGGPGESQSQGPCGGTESQCRETDRPGDNRGAAAQYDVLNVPQLD